ncbi:MAG: hypothetical protein H7A40_04620 [Chlamydiales bacterium]|nr:hypothetical protein [Chlamydiales bacterium]
MGKRCVKGAYQSIYSERFKRYKELSRIPGDIFLQRGSWLSLGSCKIYLNSFRENLSPIECCVIGQALFTYLGHSPEWIPIPEGYSTAAKDFMDTIDLCSHLKNLKDDGNLSARDYWEELRDTVYLMNGLDKYNKNIDDSKETRLTSDALQACADALCDQRILAKDFKEELVNFVMELDLDDASKPISQNGQALISEMIKIAGRPEDNDKSIKIITLISGFFSFRFSILETRYNGPFPNSSYDFSEQIKAVLELANNKGIENEIISKLETALRDSLAGNLVPQIA